MRSSIAFRTTRGQRWCSLARSRRPATSSPRCGASRHVEELAPASSLAAEAQRARFALEDPQASLEIDAVLRAAYQAPTEDLDTIAARARKLAVAHTAWAAYFAVGIAERRLERWRAARDAFGEAIRVSPGCTPAHMEVVAAHVALDDPGRRRSSTPVAPASSTATPRARWPCSPRRSSPPAQRDEAREAIDRSLALDATDEANRALAERIRAGRARTSTLTRLRDTFARWRRR